MKFSLDRYAHLDSVIHRWPQRSKFISLLILIFSFAFVNHLLLLPVMVVVTAVLYKLSRLPLSFLLSRLRYPGLFILAVVVLLPFLSGKIVLWQWGWLVLRQEGCLSVLRIVTRFICILTVSLVLFGTAPFLASIKVLRSLGLPSIIVDMMLLTYRYLEELTDILTNMQRAMKLRGFEKKALDRRTLKMLSQLVGTLLLRSYEQSKRVYQAMVLRGYHYHKSTLFERNALGDRSLSYVLVSSTLFISLGFVLTEITLRSSLAYFLIINLGN